MNSHADWNWRLAFTGTNTRHHKSLFTRARRAHISLPQSDVPICLHAARTHTQTENTELAQSTGAESSWASERDANQVISLCCVRKIVAGRLLRIIHTRRATNISPASVSPAGSYSNWNCWWVSRWRAQWPAAVCVRPVHPPQFLCYSKWMNGVCGARSTEAVWCFCFAAECERCRVHEVIYVSSLGETRLGVCARRWDTCVTKEVTRVRKNCTHHPAGQEKSFHPREFMFSAYGIIAPSAPFRSFLSSWIDTKIKLSACTEGEINSFHVGKN